MGGSILHAYMIPLPPLKVWGSRRHKAAQRMERRAELFEQAIDKAVTRGFCGCWSHVGEVD